MRGHVEHTRARVGRTGRPIDTIATGENSRFPATLSAYDAVHDWITANGYNIALLIPRAKYGKTKTP